MAEINQKPPLVQQILKIILVGIAYITLVLYYILPVFIFILLSLLLVVGFIIDKIYGAIGALLFMAMRDLIAKPHAKLQAWLEIQAEKLKNYGKT